MAVSDTPVVPAEGTGGASSEDRIVTLPNLISLVRLLCMPRILGYGFNPLSVYFCYRPDGTLAALLYEVTNTP